MFDSLLSWCNGWWQVFQEVIQEAWDWGRKSVVWWVGMLIAAISITGDTIEWVTGHIIAITTTVAGVHMPDAHGSFAGLGSMLAIANVFFPVEEAFALMTLVITALITAIGIRLLRWVRGMLIA